MGQAVMPPDAMFVGDPELSKCEGEQRAIDVVLHVVNEGPAFNIDVDLGHGVRIASVTEEVVTIVKRLCDAVPMHAFGGEAIDARRVLYAFSRVENFTTTGWQFDPDGYLSRAIQASRLLRPTSIGFEFSARLVLNPRGDTIENAIRGPVSGSGSLAYVAGDPSPQNWLTPREAGEVAKLFDAFVTHQTTRPERVNRALWRHEFAAREAWLDVRWLVIASGLEALLKVHYPRGTRPRPPGSTKQFIDRTVALARRYPTLSWTPAEAERAYELRSEMAHGAKVTHASPDLPLYISMETLLRYALMEALTDPAFESLFQTDSAIESAFPLQP